MENKPDWALNAIKYQRALASAKHPENEKEVKGIYISFGGKLVGLSEINEEIVMEDEKIETTETPVVEEVVETVEEATPVVEEEIVAEEVVETPVEEVVEEAPAVE